MDRRGEKPILSREARKQVNQQIGQALQLVEEAPGVSVSSIKKLLRVDNKAEIDRQIADSQGQNNT